MRMNLKPCPFCGNEVTENSVDRIITIKCPKCNFERSFPGLISNKKTDVPVKYSDGTVSDYEFYNKNAYKEAEEAWNLRNNVTSTEITSDDAARYLNDGDRCNDEDFAEVFVMFHKLRHPELYDQSVESVTKEDMLSADIDAITSEINTILSEIIPADSECDRGAWWKKEE